MKTISVFQACLYGLGTTLKCAGGGKLSSVKSMHISSELKELLSQLVHPDMLQRPNIEDTLEVCLVLLFSIFVIFVYIFFFFILIYICIYIYMIYTDPYILYNTLILGLMVALLAIFVGGNEFGLMQGLTK